MKKRIPLSDFMACVMRAAVEGWNQSDVANELGISAPAVSLRLKSLRDKGVKVPDLKGWMMVDEKPTSRLVAAYR